MVTTAGVEAGTVVAGRTGRLGVLGPVDSAGPAATTSHRSGGDTAGRTDTSACACPESRTFTGAGSDAGTVSDHARPDTHSPTTGCCTSD